MINPGKTLTILSIAALVAGVAGCEKSDVAADGKGPAERAGKQIDQAAAKAGEELGKVTEQAGKGLRKAGEKLQNTGEQAEKKESQQ